MTTGAAEGRVETPGASPEGSGRKPREYGRGAANVTGRRAFPWPEAATGLMEEIVSRGNMMAAYSRVVGNKGAPGVDAMPVTALKGYLQQEWPRIREELLAGRYTPQPVRKVEIPTEKCPGSDQANLLIFKDNPPRNTRSRRLWADFPGQNCPHRFLATRAARMHRQPAHTRDFSPASPAFAASSL